MHVEVRKGSGTISTTAGFFYTLYRTICLSTRPEGLQMEMLTMRHFALCDSNQEHLRYLPEIFEVIIETAQDLRINLIALETRFL